MWILRPKRAAPLRRTTNHPHTHGRLTVPPMMEAGLHTEAFLWRANLVTLYFGCSLETTPFPLSLDLKPPCVSFPVGNYVGLSCLTRASFSTEGRLSLWLVFPGWNFRMPNNLYFKSDHHKHTLKIGANPCISLWWGAQVGRKPRTLLCYREKTPLSPALTFRKNKRKLSKWEHT